MDKISHQRYLLNHLGRDPANPGTVNLGDRIIGTNEGSAVVFVISFARLLLFDPICLCIYEVTNKRGQATYQPLDLSNSFF